MSGTLKLDLAQFRELEAFATFGSELDKVSAAQLERGYRLTELLKQNLNSPMPVEEQVVSIFAGTGGYLDDIPVSDVKRFEVELLEFMPPSRRARQHPHHRCAARGRQARRDHAGVQGAVHPPGDRRRRFQRAVGRETRAMAGGQERILRRRIKTVESTKKITKAMELIAASRIVKAQARVKAARPYSEQITEVIRNLAAGGAGLSHPLLQPRDEVRTVAYIVVTSDRGLCGGYNTGVIRAAEQAMRADQQAGRDSKLYVVGKKANTYFRFRHVPIEATFLGVTDQPTLRAGPRDRPCRRRRVQRRRGRRGRDRLHAVPVGRHAARRRAPPDAARHQRARDEQRREQPVRVRAGPRRDPRSRLLPRYAEARMFAALLDASASEHAARQRAMKAATDNAEELIKTLTRVMNRARQDAITTEIMEIVSGAEALRQRPATTTAARLRVPTTCSASE